MPITCNSSNCCRAKEEGLLLKAKLSLRVLSKTTVTCGRSFCAGFLLGCLGLGLFFKDYLYIEKVNLSPKSV